MWDQETISSVGNAAFVVIWLIYLHLFLRDYRRRNRPYVIIHHAQGG